jgi:hypothetical protein
VPSCGTSHRKQAPPRSTGYSSGHPPPGMSGTGPRSGPPASIVVVGGALVVVVGGGVVVVVGGVVVVVGGVVGGLGGWGEVGCVGVVIGGVVVGSCTVVSSRVVGSGVVGSGVVGSGVVVSSCAWAGVVGSASSFQAIRRVKPPASTRAATSILSAIRRILTALLTSEHPTPSRAALCPLPGAPALGPGLCGPPTLYRVFGDI